MKFLPGRMEGGGVKLPFGDLPLSDKLRSTVEGGNGSRDVIVGLRPEHFEDAAVEQDEHSDRMKFRTKVDVVESMGSELYVYFDVESQRQDAAEGNERGAHGG